MTVIDNNTLLYPCSDLAELWSLRILVHLKGWKKLFRGSELGMPTEDILESLNIGELTSGQVDTQACLLAMKRRLLELERAKPTLPDDIKHNLSRINELIELNATEQKILVFAALYNNHPGLEEAADTLGRLTIDAIAKVLSKVLCLPKKEVQQSLSEAGLLITTGLLGRVRSNRAELMQNRLELLDGFSDVLFGDDSDVMRMLQEYFVEMPGSELRPADYAHVQPSFDIISRYVGSTSHRKQFGTNILLYGPPGTGKTEFARTLAEEHGLKLYEIGYMDNENDAMGSSRRFSAYQLSQHVLSRQGNALIVFDEIEDVFSDSDAGPAWRRRSSTSKAWINRTLENNPVPAIWITNDIDQIDPAYLRRFSCVVELDVPPRKVRERILRQYLSDIPVSDQWIARLSENAALSPAEVEMRASIVRALGDREPAENETHLGRLFENTLRARGISEPLMVSHEDPVTYRLDALNPDHDLRQLARGLAKRPEGRVCLYGPPGTGKSAFGYYLGRALEMPVLVKRASDLLNPYVGVTEHNIRGMFREAKRDESVLLLDEADSFLRDRRKSRASWEVTQVNELLTRMEEFDGIFVCSTNLVEELDDASLRRFDLKIKFNYLESEQIWRLFCQVLEDQGSTIKNPQKWINRVGLMTNLTPGDFTTVVRQNRLSDVPLSAGVLLAGLQREVASKNDRKCRSIGFTADL